MAVPGFPNFFMLYGPNTNVGSNSVIFMLEAQAHYIVRALKYLRRKGKSYVAVRPDTMANFIAKIDRWMEGTVWLTRCSNYFRAANGRVVTQWPRSASAFWEHDAPVQGDGLHLRPPSGTLVGRERGSMLVDAFDRLDPALRQLGAGAHRPVARDARPDPGLTESASPRNRAER